MGTLENANKTIMRYHYKMVRMTMIKNLQIINVFTIKRMK